jgi:hypothetical protein
MWDISSKLLFYITLSLIVFFSTVLTGFFKFLYFDIFKRLECGS